jgi:cyclopropane fatty-acyl-phospholipid synthase-like methyltransferase
MTDWYTDFFTELPNAFWRAAVPAEATRAEVDFLERAGRLRPGSRVLDFPCGSGRHSLELARRGHRVTGLDVSAEAIEHGRNSARAEGLDVDLRVGDMACVPIDLRVDLAICMGNSFGYLEHAGTVRFLADLACIVEPGGALVIDSGFVAESMLPNLQMDEPPMTLGGIEADSVNEYDAANSRWITHFTFRRGGQVHRGTSVQHVYTSAELVRMVRAAGFAQPTLYADPAGAPYAVAAPRLLLVARR